MGKRIYNIDGKNYEMGDHDAILVYMMRDDLINKDEQIKYLLPI